MAFTIFVWSVVN